MSASFPEFFMDATIPGHALLLPSIKVREYIGRLFSPLPSGKCAGASEVIQRLILGIVLPVLAVIAFVFIPLGLLIKKSSTLCCAPRRNLPESPSFTPTPGNPGFSAPQRKRIRSSKEIDESTEDEVLLDVRKMLAKASGFGEIATQTVDDAESLLGALNSPKAQELRKWINILRRQAKSNDGTSIPKLFSSLTEEPPSPRGSEYNDYLISDTGEIPVATNGDCLFASFSVHAQMNNSYTGDAKEEREKALTWMKEHYSDPELKAKLINSLFEHTLRQIDRLKETIPPEIEGESVDDKTLRIQQTAVISHEIEILMTDKMQYILNAIEERDARKKFSHIEGLIPGYLEEMAKPGIFGGAAELYALSTLHEVCVVIHSKNGNWISRDNKQKINRHFSDKKPRHFTLEKCHYNPFFPKEPPAPHPDDQPI